MEDPGSTSLVYAQFIVPQRYVKRIKTALEARQLFNKRRGIERHNPTDGTTKEPHLSICTNIPLPLDPSPASQPPSPPIQDEASHKILETQLAALGLQDIQSSIRITPYHTTSTPSSPPPSNPVLQALRKGLETLPPELFLSINTTIPTLIDLFPTSYSIYHPMLLLPHNAFASPPWTALLDVLKAKSLTPWPTVVETLGLTHIAVNAGIPQNAVHNPLLTSSSSSSSSSSLPPSTNTTTTTTPSNPKLETENILRSPTHLLPLHGPFGPAPSPTTLLSPSPLDFTSTLWTSTTQNGIFQTWAPLYTMFSRGNLREKTRILNLPSVAEAVKQGGEKGCAAVDLYAGIGYFAFAYKKAGVRQVLGWEINGWSVEGWGRGIKGNGWRGEVVGVGREGAEEVIRLRGEGTEGGRGEEQCATAETKEEEEEKRKKRLEAADFILFPESNVLAPSSFTSLKRRINVPPVRHVNLGFLPSSRGAWGTAVEVMDRELGGWAHVHENVGVGEVEERKAEVVQGMQERLGGMGLRGEVRCEHVERVKTYAPGVVHVVFDVWVGPTRGM